MDGIVERQFDKMGARVRIRPPDRPPRMRRDLAPPKPPAVRLDIGSDRRGEFFDVRLDTEQATVEVVDVRPLDRHLLLMSRDLATGEKEKFLCGHDERHWFVAAIPPGSASNVASAMDALMPAEVARELDRRHVRRQRRHQRRNAAFVRQGEWFFVPAEGITVAEHLALRNEPLRRGSGKPHVVDYLVRMGGETVYVSSRRPSGLTEAKYRTLLRQNPDAQRWRWQVMRREATVYAKGRVRHPDHRTVVLADWHRVLMNREANAPAMRNVAFLD